MPEKETSKMWSTAVEQSTPVAARIHGSVPSWVEGTYLRVGPGKFDFGNEFTMNHWFDGYAIISKFEIRDGEVKLTTKYLESDAYQRALAAKKPVVCEFGTKAFSEPGRSFISRIVSSIIPEMSDNANINLFKLGKDVFVTGETCFFRSLSPEKLITTEKHDSHKYFGLNVASAHPITDTDGNTYNIGTTILTGLKYHIIRIPPITGTSKDSLKKSKLITTIPSRWNTLFSYNHSFGMTENYLILIEQPFVLNATKLLSFGLGKGTGQNQCFSDWCEWKPELGNRFYIVEKETGKVVKTEYLSETPFFFLHFINCYEEDGHLILNLSVFDSAEVLFAQYLEKLRGGYVEDDNNRAYGVQYVIPLNLNSDLNGSFNDCEEGTNLVTLKSTGATAVKQGKAIILSPEEITGKGLELPIVNKDFKRKKHRYYWATGLTAATEFQNCICKVNVETKETKTWRENFHIFGEPVFIQRPGAVEEDDGVVMACMTDVREDSHDCLFFFDGATMKEIGRASFRARIPPSIHGLFLGNS